MNEKIDQFTESVKTKLNKMSGHMKMDEGKARNWVKLRKRQPQTSLKVGKRSSKNQSLIIMPKVLRTRPSKKIEPNERIVK